MEVTGTTLNMAIAEDTANVYLVEEIMKTGEWVHADGTSLVATVDEVPVIVTMVE